MQELGYIDSNMEPNFEQITQRIGNLPVSNELKSDIQEGLQFCQKFSVSTFFLQRFLKGRLPYSYHRYSNGHKSDIYANDIANGGFYYNSTCTWSDINKRRPQVYLKLEIKKITVSPIAPLASVL